MGRQLTRKQKEDRAYALVLTTGGAGVLTVALAALAVFGVVGAGLPILTAAIAAIAFILFRRTVR